MTHQTLSLGKYWKLFPTTLSLLELLLSSKSLTPPNPCKITTGNMTQYLLEAARLLSHAKAINT